MKIVEATKEYLNEIRYIDKEVDAKEKVREKMAERLTTVKATKHKEVDVQGGVQTTLEDRIVEYMDYTEEINELIDKLINKKMTAMDEIENVDSGLYRTLLTERYINNKQWSEVADTLGYEERYTLQLHNDALREFKKANKEHTKKH